MRESLDGPPPVSTLEVARGRTVCSGPTHIMIDGVSQPNPAKVVFFPGEQVELAAEEAQRLLATGFVVVPGTPQARPADGDDSAVPTSDPGETVGLVKTEITGGKPTYEGPGLVGSTTR